MDKIWPSVDEIQPSCVLGSAKVNVRSWRAADEIEASMDKVQLSMDEIQLSVDENQPRDYARRVADEIQAGMNKVQLSLDEI